MITPETQLLNLAGNELRLHRVALADCVKVLEGLSNLALSQYPHHTFWTHGGDGERALYEAKKALRPRYPVMQDEPIKPAPEICFQCHQPFQDERPFVLGMKHICNRCLARQLHTAGKL